MNRFCRVLSSQNSGPRPPLPSLNFWTFPQPIINIKNRFFFSEDLYSFKLTFQDQFTISSAFSFSNKLPKVFNQKKYWTRKSLGSCKPVIVNLFLICIHISLGACYPIDSYFPFKSQLWITETIFSSLFFHSFFKLNWYWKRIDFPYFYDFSELNYICLRNLENSIRQNLLGRLGKLCVGAWEVWI